MWGQLSRRRQLLHCTENSMKILATNKYVAEKNSIAFLLFSVNIILVYTVYYLQLTCNSHIYYLIF